MTLSNVCMASLLSSCCHSSSVCTKRRKIELRIRLEGIAFGSSDSLWTRKPGGSLTIPSSEGTMACTSSQAKLLDLWEYIVGGKSRYLQVASFLPLITLKRNISNDDNSNKNNQVLDTPLPSHTHSIAPIVTHLCCTVSDPSSDDDSFDSWTFAALAALLSSLFCCLSVAALLGAIWTRSWVVGIRGSGHLARTMNKPNKEQNIKKYLPSYMYNLFLRRSQYWNK